MLPGRLHHIGFVVGNIEKEIEGFCASLLSTWEGVFFHDPLQKVRVTFLRNSHSSDARIELLEPAAEDSPIQAFLKKSGGLHHLCYEVGDLEEALQHARSVKARIVKTPLPAVAFEGRQIAWILTAQKLLVEFLEETKQP